MSRARAAVRGWTDRLLSADVGWSAVFVVVVLGLVASLRLVGPAAAWVPGEIAEVPVVAPADMDVPDPDLTAERRRQAAAAVPEVYVHDTERVERIVTEIVATFADARRSADPDGRPTAPAELAGGSAALLEPRVESVAVAALRETMSRPVVGAKAMLERQPAIELLRLPGRRGERVDSYERFVDLAEARRTARRTVQERLELDEADRRRVADMVSSFVDATVHLDSEATLRRRRAEADAVPPVLVRVAAGDVLVAAGEPIPAVLVERLRDSLGVSVVALGLREFLGLTLVTALLAFFLHRYSSFHQRRFREFPHLHALVVSVMLATLLLARGVLWLAGELADGLPPPFDRVELYAYAVPLGVGSILVTLLVNARAATVYAAFTALVFGLMIRESFHAALWAAIVQLAGVYAISAYRDRAALLRAGLIVGGAGAVAAIACESLQGRLDPVGGVAWAATLAFLGGAIGVGLLVSFTLPLLERLFNVLTDIRLLELSNVNNPLLQELAVRAPGTYNHSLVVGTLAEEGAKSIGANSLFCRVAAFYHDVGKMNHAEYFVENQRGVNPHDRLSPSMSALIIASHVKDGIKMASDAGLPGQIVDVIPQHHGTRLMTFFYEKARSAGDESAARVKEADFRYPGPKPQTREAAIFMLADGVEAAARTIEEPTPHRLGEMIRKIVNAVVLDGQLDECDLTFADLDRIQEAFLRFLVGMYHRRVDYPGFDFGGGPDARASAAEETPA